MHIAYCCPPLFCPSPPVSARCLGSGVLRWLLCCLLCSACFAACCYCMTVGWSETEVLMDVSSRRLALVQHRHLPAHGLLSFLSLLRAFLLLVTVIKRNQTFLLALSEIGCTYLKSTTWSPAYINETKTPRIFCQTSAHVPEETSLSGGVLRAISDPRSARLL